MMGSAVSMTSITREIILVWDGAKKMMKNSEALEIITNAIQKEGMTKQQDIALAVAQKCLTRQQWISTKDRLPKNNRSVLIYCKFFPLHYSTMYIAKAHLDFNDNGDPEGWSFDNSMEEMSLEDTAYWMELPEEP